MCIKPMLPSEADGPFSSDDYIFEPKLDGVRMIVWRDGGRTRLFTKEKQECTSLFPELLQLAEDGIVLDGEAAVLGADGRLDRDGVLRRLERHEESAVRGKAAELSVNYIVFDVLKYKGIDLRGLPLYQRKLVLEQIDFGNPYIAKIPYMEADGETMFREARRFGLEGMVAKQEDSIYVSHRSNAWRTVIDWTELEAVVTGCTKDRFGLQLSAAGEDGVLRPAGIVREGLKASDKMLLYRMRDALKIGEDEAAVYLRPELKVRVKCRGRAGQYGLLRSPVFQQFVL